MEVLSVIGISGYGSCNQLHAPMNENFALVLAPGGIVVMDGHNRLSW